MAIYSFNISNVSRGVGSTSVATLAYITAQKFFDERIGKAFSYNREDRVISVGTITTENAPEKYKNPGTLFNEIEKYEKADNARTAKKIMAALPIEFDIETQEAVVRNFVEKHIVGKGYCATYAIHTGKDNQNPHVHILIANRQVNDKGEWSLKRKAVYLLDEKGERIPVIDKTTGKQKVDKRNRKQWKRISVEQNPLDKEEALLELRAAWAEECNRYLDEAQRISHESYAARGILQEPTIHEGYTARKMEREGKLSDRCQINREIRARNKVLASLIYAREKIAEKLMGFAHGIKELLEVKGLITEARNAQGDILRCLNDQGKITDPLQTVLTDQVNQMIGELEAAGRQTDQEKAELAAVRSEMKQLQPWQWKRRKELNARENAILSKSRKRYEKVVEKISERIDLSGKEKLSYAYLIDGSEGVRAYMDTALEYARRQDRTVRPTNRQKYSQEALKRPIERFCEAMGKIPQRYEKNAYIALEEALKRDLKECRHINANDVKWITEELWGTQSGEDAQERGQAGEIGRKTSVIEKLNDRNAQAKARKMATPPERKDRGRER